MIVETMMWATKYVSYLMYLRIVTVFEKIPLFISKTRLFQFNTFSTLCMEDFGLAENFNTFFLFLF